MTWFFAVLVVLLLGAIAVVAAGRGGSMAEVYDDRRDVRVQAERPLDAEDLRRVRFTTAFRGYRMSEVDALLERLARELDEARQEKRPEQEGSRQEKQPEQEGPGQEGPGQEVFGQEGSGREEGD